MSDPSEPHTLQQASWRPDLETRVKWHDEIRQEFNKIISMGVWRNVGSTSIPSGRRLEVYQARLVEKGFCQIPGLDFTDNFSPVVNDVTFRGC